MHYIDETGVFCKSRAKIRTLFDIIDISLIIFFLVSDLVNVAKCAFRMSRNKKIDLGLISVDIFHDYGMIY